MSSPEPVYLADERGADLGRRDGVTHSDVAISAHDGKEDGAGELVDAGCGHVGLAHEVPEGPGLPAHCCEQKGNADKEALVRHG